MSSKFDRGLIGILLLSLFLNVYNIWSNDFANEYYTAAVTSMLTSFHNFFYASFDPAGFVTVDKPPVTFWVQTAFAFVFGVHGWSVVLPQALAGVGSVLLLYLLIKPTFGRLAAQLAALIMACTPIAVAVSRTNNIDSMLVFTLLLGTWMLFRAIEKNKVSWLIFAFVCIGIGFNMKMLQAYMVVPAFALFYFIASRFHWKKKILSLISASIVLAVVSLSWAVVVDQVPASERPYEGSSQTNSVLELAFGYNGMQRLLGMSGGGTQDQTKNPQAENQAGQQLQNEPPNGTGHTGATPPSRPDGQGAGGAPDQMNGAERPAGNENGGGMFNTGTPGPLRLFQSELSDQISWLLPFVLIGSVALLTERTREKRRWTLKKKVTIFWLSWFIPGFIFFSVAGFFHHYYLIMLAPPIAALVASGWTALVEQYRLEQGFRSQLLPTAVLITTLFELFVLYSHSEQVNVLWGVGVGLVGIVSAIVLYTRKFLLHASFKYIALCGLLIQLVLPLYWATTTLSGNFNSVLPVAGPQSEKGMGMPGGDGGAQPEHQSNGTDTTQQSSKIDEKMYNYLTEHRTGEKYLFATESSHSSAAYIIEKGASVMTMGGFSGSDPILNVSQLEQLVRNGEVKYFFISESGRGGNQEISKWIQENGQEIPQTEWQTTTSESSNHSEQADGGFGKGMGMGNNKLYEVTLNK